MEKKIAVLFPGIGYHTDKPLLYYSKKLARKRGYEIVEVKYGPLPSGVKGNAEKMRKALGGSQKPPAFPGDFICCVSACRTASRS